MVDFFVVGDFMFFDIENLVEEVWDLLKWERDCFLSSLCLIFYYFFNWDY